LAATKSRPAVRLFNPSLPNAYVHIMAVHNDCAGWAPIGRCGGGELSRECGEQRTCCKKGER